MALIDFSYFPTNSTKTLGIVDTSIYEGSVPTSPYLYIIIPGFDSASKIRFKTQKQNIINSNNLGITNVTNPKDLIDIPDGVYGIRYDVIVNNINESVEKNFLRTELLQQKFTKAINKLNLGGCPNSSKAQDIKLLSEVEFMIYGAIAAANRCDIDKAIELYRSSEATLNKYLLDC